MPEELKNKLREEFILRYLPLFQDQELEDITKKHEYSCGIDSLIVNEQIQKRAMYKANECAGFWLSRFETLLKEQSEKSYADGYSDRKEELEHIIKASYDSMLDQKMMMYKAELVEKIKSSDKNFGIVDSNDKGGAMLIEDIIKIIKE